jgi:hypothetical protein
MTMSPVESGVLPEGEAGFKLEDRDDRMRVWS